MRGKAGGSGKPVFLAKYIPATPPLSDDKRRPLSQGSSGGGAFGRESPCPSPTPLFNQLYAAISHWERVLADSPEVLKEVSVLKGKYSPERESEEEERGGGGALKRTTSMYNLTVDDEEGSADGPAALSREQAASLRRKSSPGGLLLARRAANKVKQSEKNCRRMVHLTTRTYLLTLIPVDTLHPHVLGKECAMQRLRVAWTRLT